MADSLQSPGFWFGIYKEFEGFFTKVFKKLVLNIWLLVLFNIVLSVFIQLLVKLKFYSNEVVELDTHLTIFFVVFGVVSFMNFLVLITLKPSKNKNKFIVYQVFNTSPNTKKIIKETINNKIKGNDHFYQEELSGLWKDFDEIKKIKDLLFTGQKGIVQVYNEIDGQVFLSGILLPHDNAFKKVDSQSNYVSSKRLIEAELLFKEYKPVGADVGNIGYDAYIAAIISLSHAYVIEGEFSKAKQVLDEVKNNFKKDLKEGKKIEFHKIDTFLKLYLGALLKKYNYYNDNIDLENFVKELNKLSAELERNFNVSLSYGIELAKMRTEFLIFKGSHKFCNATLNKINVFLSERELINDEDNHQRYLVLKLNQIFIFYWIENDKGFNNSINDLKSKENILCCFEHEYVKPYFESIIDNHIDQINAKNGFSIEQVQKAQNWKQIYKELIKDIE